MTLPPDFTAVALTDTGGIPQTATLGPGIAAPLRVSLVAVAADLAALLSSNRDRVLRIATSARIPDERAAVPPDPWLAADVTARAALTAQPGGTLDAGEVLVVLVVHENRRVVTVWPPLPGRPLPVRDEAGLRGALWVDEVVVSAGSLVAAGPTGARFAIGWRAGAVGEAKAPDREEDPYVLLT